MYVALLAFMGLMFLIYFVSSLWLVVGQVVFFLGFLMFVTGLLANRIAGKRSDRIAKVSMDVFFVGFGTILGFAIFAQNNPFNAILMLGTMVFLTLFIFLVEIWAWKTQERLEIRVEGGHSLDLVHRLIAEIGNTINQRGFPNRHYGTNFQLDLADKERIIIGMTLKAGDEEARYLLVLRTNRSRESFTYRTLRNEISSTVLDLDREGYLDSLAKSIG